MMDHDVLVGEPVRGTDCVAADQRTGLLGTGAAAP